MLHTELIQVVLIPVIASSIIREKHDSVAANIPIDVCFCVRAGGPKSCRTLEDLTSLGEFMSKAHVKVEIHDQVLTKLHKYSFAYVEYTKELVIWNCGVVEIESGAFHNSLSLLKVDIQRNRLEVLGVGIFNGLLLTHLNLAHNKIRTIDPDALSHMQNIEEVNLLNNLISAYDVKWFNKTPLLKSLYFQNNTIKEIPEMAFGNLIDRLQGVNLFFSFNLITKVHTNAFQGMGKTRINKLHLDHNLLETWSEELSLTIDELDISFNRIRDMKGSLRSTIKNNTLMHFMENLYNCLQLKEIKKIGDDRGEHNDWFFKAYVKCRVEAKNKLGVKPVKNIGGNVEIFSSPFGV